MPLQAANWSCSACALAWVERATGVNPGASEASAIEEIGYPENINATYGLMDGSGAHLAEVLDRYPLDAWNNWVSFDQAYAIAGSSPGCLGGVGWYHWVGIRGVNGSSLWLANSAPGYRGIYETLTRDQFNSLGPFAMVYLT